MFYPTWGNDHFWRLLNSLLCTAHTDRDLWQRQTTTSVFFLFSGTTVMWLCITGSSNGNFKSIKQAFSWFNVTGIFCGSKFLCLDPKKYQIILCVSNFCHYLRPQKSTNNVLYIVSKFDSLFHACLGMPLRVLLLIPYVMRVIISPYIISHLLTLVAVTVVWSMFI